MFKSQNEKGFTLIELLIVVAIIGILAAIAIPQFAAYRIRGYNSAANSDSRNAATAEEALFADSQGYGSAAVAVLGVATASAAAGPFSGPQNGATVKVAGTMVQNGQGAVPFSLSNGVKINSAVWVPTGSSKGVNYVLITKHDAGDSCYGRDSDSTSMFKGIAVAGAVLLAADTVTAADPATATSLDDLTGKDAGTGCKTFSVM